MAVTKFSPKDPSETILLTFDFTNLLVNQNELLTSSDWTVEVAKGIDINAAAMLTGGMSLGRTFASNFITNGVVGNTYVIHVIVTTSTGQRLKMTGSMDIKVQ
jgi:hypothetical protein